MNSNIIVSLLFVTLINYNLASSEQKSIESIVNFLKNLDESNWLRGDKNVTLILGNTGVGKSTLATLISNTSSLYSVGSAGEYLYEDKNRISSTSTTKSFTHIPELVRNVTSGVTYYDIPGFEDTRGLEYDLSLTYFLQKILRHGDMVKFVFVIDYGSVKKGGDRINFPKLAQYATTVIKNITKYRDGISMVVTKVDSNAVLQDDGETYKMVDDKTKKQIVTQFLAEVMNEKNNSAVISAQDQEIIDFIQIFLESEEKIGLVRSPNKAGWVQDIPLVRNIIKNLNVVINQNTKYIKKSMKDFGKTIAIESINTINNYFDEILKSLGSDVQKISHEIIHFYAEKEKQTVDIYELHRQLQFGSGNLSRIQPKISRNFFHQIVHTLNTLEISVPSNYLRNISRNIEFIGILGELSDQIPKPDHGIFMELNKAKEYLENSYKWYKFLIDFYDSLITYDVRNKIDNISWKLDVSSGANVKDIGLESLLQSINFNKYSDVETMQVKEYQLKTLKTIWDQMKNGQLIEECTAPNDLTVVGKFIKISDVIKMKCWQTAKYIRIFALNTLFIDANIDKSGNQVVLTFIAPTWRIIGEKVISLNGSNGIEHGLAAANGDQVYIHGRDGKIGENGGSAGHFLGIGRTFFDSNLLKIFANGGNGGDGQNGGNGSDGKDCDEPPYDPNQHGTWHLWGNRGIEYTYTGSNWNNKYIYYDVTMTKNYRASGNGGNGGRAGNGGQAGNVTIIEFLEKPNFQIISYPGK